MTRHHIQPSRRATTGEPGSGLGWWLVAAALVLFLAAVLVPAWLGANALVAQDRVYAERDLRTEADLLANRVDAQLLHLLDELESAALHGWEDSAVTWSAVLRSPALVAADEAPSDPVQAQAVRQARAAGWSLLVDGRAQPATLVLAASDHPDRPSRIAVAVITPEDLVSAVPRREPLASLALLDRAHHPLLTASDPTLWSDLSASGGPARVDGMFRTVRPVPEFPLYVGLARPMSGTWAVLMQNGIGLAVGAATCLLLAGAGVVLLAVLVRRRFMEAEHRRTIAFQEMEHVQKLSSIGRLAAGVAHEINNPLAIIAEKAGLMKDLACAAQDMPKAQRFIALTDSILQAVTRCRAVTHRLLGFARRMEVRPMELDLNDVLRETLGFLERDALFRNITLDLQLDPELPGIESDRGQLQQIFLNLLNNAMAAVPDKGRIRVATRREQSGVAVEIEDNGVGMSRETLAHIFEPFFSTKGEHGTGLGLSITYGIVDKLGGSIEVASAEGEGSMFTIHLPLRAAIAEQPAAAVDLNPQPAHGGTK